jgi:hypothetical protein
MPRKSVSFVIEDRRSGIYVRVVSVLQLPAHLSPPWKAASRDGSAEPILTDTTHEDGGIDGIQLRRNRPEIVRERGVVDHGSSKCQADNPSRTCAMSSIDRKRAA